MATANQELFDAALRHQVALRRYSSGLQRKMIDMVEAADRELSIMLRTRLGDDFSAQRLRALLVDVRALRRALEVDLASTARERLVILAEAEAAWEQRILQDAVPVQLDMASIPLGRLQTTATAQPFHGRTLRQWFTNLGAADRSKLDQAITLGVTMGETTDDLVRRVIGTRAAGFADGIVATNRRGAEAIVRTAVTHVSNAARGTVWDANQDIIWGLRWTATLDGRTSLICQGRDGAIAVNPERDIPPGTDLLDPQDARPPGHVGCRSVMVAMLSPDMIEGDRPFVADGRTRQQRERDFRAQAREEAGDGWSDLTEKQRRRRITDVRNRWGDENIGTVPNSTTYEEWMRRQSAEFQDATLGPARAKLFRDGDVTLDQFTDVGGRTRTLEELDNLL